MVNWSEQLLDMDRRRRRAYVLAAAVATVVQAGMIVIGVRTGDTVTLLSTVLGTLVTAAIIPAIVWWRVPTGALNVVIAGLITAVEVAEFAPYVTQPEVKPQAFMSFTLMCTLWFGLVSMRHAMMLSAVAYAAFAALVLSRPVYDLSLLLYLACVTTVVGVVASFGQHVSAQQQRAATFHEQSLTDALTGLPNRRAALELVRARWAQGAVGGMPGAFALLMLDLDHFKAVNDRHGHTVGDAVLAATGPALRALLGPDDVVARWGGEEFMLLLSAPTARAAYATVEHLDGAALALPDGLPTVTFSAGAALSHEAASVEDLLEVVDRRLHAAKDGGRRRVSWTADAGPREIAAAP